MYQKIITHEDFDGLVSAVICSYALKVNHIEFTGPKKVSEARISITDKDVVCDLPYPLECGLWFDHHEANEEELRYRGIDAGEVGGKFAPEPSCARVVYEYFSHSFQFPGHFEEMVHETDIIDSFNYISISDWRRETPGKIIDSTIKLQQHGYGSDRWLYLRNLVQKLKVEPLTSVARSPKVQERYKLFQAEERDMLELIGRDSHFLDEDEGEQLIIIDTTRHKRQPKIVKQLAFLLHPDALAVAEVKTLFRDGVKTNDLAFSVSLSLNLSGKDHSKDVGDIFRLLNMGSGHKGAGAGTLACDSKEHMLRAKEQTLHKIFRMFEAQ